MRDPLSYVHRFTKAPKPTRARSGIVAGGFAASQPGSETSFGHLTMAHPELWAQHVGEFMRWLGDAPLQVNQAR
jgi:hypothetical protein